MSPSTHELLSAPDREGRFGPYGGRYIPETLVFALDELERAYRLAQEDDAFQRELADLYANYVGRPSPLYFARRMSAFAGGARIYFKREDLNHTGAFHL